MTITKSYLTTKDKKYIENYCKIQKENNDLIRPKSLASLLEGKYALFEIMQYIRSLGITKSELFHGEADYIRELPRGHIQLTNDVLFKNCYLHQYVVCKELDIPMEQVQRYVVHHQDEIKQNNNITNLWIFYDIPSHVEYHQKLKTNPNTDIEKFTLEYLKKILNKKNVDEIKQYTEILDKLKKAKKNTLVVVH